MRGEYSPTIENKLWLNVFLLLHSGGFGKNV
jgi:hypothetical protein